MTQKGEDIPEDKSFIFYGFYKASTQNPESKYVTLLVHQIIKTMASESFLCNPSTFKRPLAHVSGRRGLKFPEEGPDVARLPVLPKVRVSSMSLMSQVRSQ